MRRLVILALLVMAGSAIAGDRAIIPHVGWSDAFDQERLVVDESVSGIKATRDRVGLAIGWRPIIMTACDKQTGDRLYMSIGGQPLQIQAMTAVPGGCR